MNMHSNEVLNFNKSYMDKEWRKVMRHAYKLYNLESYYEHYQHYCRNTITQTKLHTFLCKYTHFCIILYTLDEMYSMYTYKLSCNDIDVINICSRIQVTHTHRHTHTPPHTHTHRKQIRLEKISEEHRTYIGYIHI